MATRIDGESVTVYCKKYWHYRAKKWMVASDYGYDAWHFLVKKNNKKS